MSDADGATARIAALDAHYFKGGGARAAAVLVESWTAEHPIETATAEIAETAPYEPGAFYKRELGPLLAVLQRLSAPADILIVDACVHLGPERRPGLGRRLWDALDRRAAVIGVAKSAYPGAPEQSRVYRGAGKTPLYVDAIGLDETEARARIQAMRGPHRIPTLLRQADRLARDGATPPQKLARSERRKIG